MRPAPGRLVLLGALAFIVFAIVTLPARVVVGFLADSGIRVSGVQGSVWRGRARAVAVGDYLLGKTTWRARPAALLRLRAGFRVETELANGAVQGNAAISPGGRLWLDDLRGVLPVSALSGILPAGQLDGQIGLSIDSAVLANGWPEALVGTIDLANLIVSAPDVVALGSFQIEFDESDDGGPVGRISDVEGPLSTSGQLNLGEGRAWSITLDLAPNESAPASIGDTLTLLTGPPRGGTHRFSASGNL